MKVLNRNVQRIDRLYFWIAWIAVDIVEGIVMSVGFAVWESYESDILAFLLLCLSIFFAVYTVFVYTAVISAQSKFTFCIVYALLQKVPWRRVRII